MNVRLSERALDQTLDWTSPALRQVNGSSLLSVRRPPTAPVAFDGTPYLPFVGYDDAGVAFDDDQPKVQNQAQEKQIRYTMDAFERTIGVSRPGTCIAADLGVYWADESGPVQPGASAQGRSALRRRSALPVQLRPRRRSKSGGCGDNWGRRVRVVAPDVFVAFEAGSWLRDSYRIDLGEPTPIFVMEVLSVGTVQRDLGTKRHLYKRMGVRELWTFDPKLKYIPQGVHALSRQDDQYVEIEADANTMRYPSEVLPFEFVAEGRNLRIHDAQTGAPLETDLELYVRANEQQRRADQAEAENERLRALLASLGHGDP